MAPNPRFTNAYNAMRTLGISDDEVRPILKRLLKEFGSNWELIEEDNYEILLDAYFESLEHKQEEGKGKAPISNHDEERAIPKLHLVNGDDMVSLTDNEVQVLSIEDNEIVPKTSETKMINKPSPLLHLGPLSSYLKGPCDDLNVNRRFKSISALYQNTPSPNGANLTMGPCHDDSNVNHRFKSISDIYQNGPNLNHANLSNKTQPAIAHENNHVQFLNDITKGSEKVEISLIDETGSEKLPKFNYIPNNITYQNANVNISLARIADEDCCSDCSGNCLSLSLPCACAKETGGEFAYTPQGLLKKKFLKLCMSMATKPQHNHFVYCQECPLERSRNNECIPEECKGHLVRKFIKECWRKCGCDMQCGNRLVQRGITCKLQVFFTRGGKGWGVRTLEDLPKGCFVCEYVGEILTNTELYERVLQNSNKDRHTYPVTLDADWGSEKVLNDEEALCLDATYNGNIARFINHRCFDANLIDIPVEVEVPDRHYYHIALFTNRKVKAYEELTWDYGIDFDDHEHPIKAFQCCCGSNFCRDKKNKGTGLKAKNKS
ncbi:hypothetical protein PIB30_009789 [Stylosanthes scabra]|uniref:Uncharacterized protein n=1 Tax=Stylosanthes scabra TaxID=79078 RepID=A0ABU6Y3D0_9FABA|nr:hypothetical protein [Stylosanthes scabra]